MIVWVFNLDGSNCMLTRYLLTEKNPPVFCSGGLLLFQGVRFISVPVYKS